MKFIRFIVRGLFTWSLLLFVLGAACAASPHAAEDVLGLLGFGLIAGGVLSMLFGRPAAAPSSRPATQTPAEMAPPVVDAAAAQIPGARGARVALGQHAAETTAPDALAVCFRGQIKAYVTGDSWHPVGAFAELGAEDPEYRLVALMSVYAQGVLLGSEGVYTDQDAIAYALAELVPHELLERQLPDPSHTATALCLPADVLTPQNLHALAPRSPNATLPRPPRTIGTRPSDLSLPRLGRAPARSPSLSPAGERAQPVSGDSPRNSAARPERYARHPQRPVCIRPGQYRRLTMEHRQLAITFTLEGEPVESVTHLLRAGPYVLVLQTVMPQRGLAVELHSTFVGHGSVRTQATHLLLGPVGQPAHIVTREDVLSIEDPVDRPASCVYAHCYELTALLAERGVDVKVERLPAHPVPLPQ